MKSAAGQADLLQQEPVPSDVGAASGIQRPERTGNEQPARVENAAQSRQGAEGRAANQGGLREEPSASVRRTICGS